MDALARVAQVQDDELVRDQVMHDEVKPDAVVRPLRLRRDHRAGHVELYDHSTAAGETKNIAEANPKLVAQLMAQLQRRFKRR